MQNFVIRNLSFAIIFIPLPQNSNNERNRYHIIGAGPTGLFAVFEAGLLRLKCHLIDTLPQVGGQLTELYPKKPIFDIPGYPSVGASELIDNLMEQIKQFQPEFTLGETAITLTKNNDDTFIVTTDKGTQ